MVGANKCERNIIVINEWTIKKRIQHWTQDKEQRQTKQKHKVKTKKEDQNSCVQRNKFVHLVFIESTLYM